MASVRLLNSSDLYSSPHHLNGSYHGASNERSRTPQNGLEVIETSHAVRLQQEKPHLVSLGGGRLSTSVTIHPLPEGTMRPVAQDIVVQGPGVEPEHCYIQNESGKVTLHPLAHVISIDGMAVTEPSRLHQGCMICIGRSNFFRFNHPEEAQSLKKEALPNSRLPPISNSFRPVTEPPGRFVGNPVGAPSPSSFDLDNSVDFVEKVSKFEFLAHNRSPPVASSESPRWFVRDGIRVAASPPSRACEQPPSVRGGPPASKPVAVARFTPTPPLSSSGPKSPKSPRVSALSGRASPLVAGGRCTPTSPRLGHRVASHEDIRACEVELAQQHRRAVAERLRDQEQERQERQRLEEILSLCAEYERKVHASAVPKGDKKLQRSPPSSDSGTEDVTTPPGSGSESSSAPDDTSKTSDKQLPERPSDTTIVKPVPVPATARPVPAPRTQQGSFGEALPPRSPESKATTVVISGSSPPFGPTLVHHPNRIKTNGSLAPTELDGKRAGRLLADGSVLSDGMLAVAPKKVNVTLSSPLSEGMVAAATGAAEKAPVFENPHAWKELAASLHGAGGAGKALTPPPATGGMLPSLDDLGPLKDLPQQHSLPRKLPERGGSLNIRKASEESSRVPLRRARSTSDDVSLLRRQREDSFQQIAKLKKDMFSLEARANEGMRELELEHALLTGELTDAQACQKSDFAILEEIQEEERRLGKQADLDREQEQLQLEVSRGRIEQWEQLTRELREVLEEEEEEGGGASLPRRRPELEERYRRELEGLDGERRAFEDLEFRQLERQARREEERRGPCGACRPRAPEPARPTGHLVQTWETEPLEPEPLATGPRHAVNRLSGNDSSFTGVESESSSIISSSDLPNESALRGGSSSQNEDSGSLKRLLERKIAPDEAAASWTSVRGMVELPSRDEMKERSGRPGRDALCLVLRNIADDVAIEVHLVAKPTYKRQLVKKAQIKAWLTFPGEGSAVPDGERRQPEARTVKKAVTVAIARKTGLAFRRT
ncbi:hypothetical protein HPB48_004641 [Haemaphysalis longicornis]|uniref:FHA domain-containing protein n=1 Tax=Haemaphysalis longicornis TaxID=44386 RepID=A0A9J6FQW2_HAELO|nr:hypothetical protein HPB48_004641 [Haemaphysalis longicornis]